MGMAMELFRMCTYLSFPMALFYIANKPSWFDQNVNALFEKEEKMLRSPTKEQISERLRELRKAKAERAAKLESESSGSN